MIIPADSATGPAFFCYIAAIPGELPAGAQL